MFALLAVPDSGRRRWALLLPQCLALTAWTPRDRCVTERLSGWPACFWEIPHTHTHTHKMTRCPLANRRCSPPLSLSLDSTGTGGKRALTAAMTWKITCSRTVAAVPRCANTHNSPPGIPMWRRFGGSRSTVNYVRVRGCTTAEWEWHPGEKECVGRQAETTARSRKCGVKLWASARVRRHNKKTVLREENLHRFLHHRNSPLVRYSDYTSSRAMTLLLDAFHSYVQTHTCAHLYLYLH